MITQMTALSEEPFYDEADVDIRVSALSMDLISQLPSIPLSPAQPPQIKTNSLRDPTPHSSPIDGGASWLGSAPTGVTPPDPTNHQPPLPAWEAVCSRYPNIPELWSGRSKESYLSHLIHLPAYNEIKDNPRAAGHRRAFSLRRSTNIKAALIQASGIAQDGDQRCIPCLKGAGPWDCCVRTRACNSSDGSDPMRGACANCFYNGCRTKCSFVQRNSKFSAA